MQENRCMHATVCLLHAGQPKSAGDAAKSGQFIGQFSWVTGDPIGLKGLINTITRICICYCRVQEKQCIFMLINTCNYLQFLHEHWIQIYPLRKSETSKIYQNITIWVYNDTWINDFSPIFYKFSNNKSFLYF